MTERKNSRVYSANEICNIIKTCNKCGVAEINISGIEVKFNSQGTDLPVAGMQWTQPPQTTVDTAPLKPLELNDSDMEELAEISRIQQSIEDPIGYEENVLKSFIDEEVHNATVEN